ncbi:MAG TPA: hypothetical protein VGL09_00655 [Methylomirabilota bacterium]|jgi:cobalamin biosynthesis Mg chelatase CobN
MNRLFIVLLSVLFLMGTVAGVSAQQGSAPSATPDPKPAAPAPADKTDTSTPPKASDSKAESSSQASSPSSPASPGATGSSSSSSTTTVVPDTSKSDGGSALPRSTAVERTTIFGLSPTAAVLIGAALLLVVILAIVAMTRNADTTRIDVDTRPRV